MIAMAARRSVICAIMVLVAVHRASAGPCIECKDCKGSNHCLQHCERSCPQARPQAVVNGEDCKRYGKDVAWKVSKEACDTTLLYCNGGQQKQQLGARRYFPVTLGQCANIAYGLCQERAMNGWMSPCGYAFRGHKQCSKDNFMSFYTGEVNDRCNKAVQWIDQKAGKRP